MRNTSWESGQALVLLVLALVGLIGFTALALDGGMLYAERRRGQNASDAAALASALAIIQGRDWKSVAVERVTRNGFPVVVQECDPPGPDCILGVGERWTVQVSHPPRGGSFQGDTAYVQVVLTSQVATNFAHMVFSGPLRSTTQAVARMWPEQSIAPGYAMYAATREGCKGLWFAGTGDTVIRGGSIFSNSEAHSANCHSCVQGGAGVITVEPPGQIQVVGGFEMGGSGAVSPAPVEGVSHQPLRPVPLPDCSGLPDYGAVKVVGGRQVTLQPGRYASISVGASASVSLEPGMYCIYGDDGFAATGGSVSGTGVMLYIQQGPFDLGGNTFVDLRAETTKGTLLDASRNDWRGMLLYVDPGNDSDIKITGTSGSVYAGTIYAPGSLCNAHGTGDSLGLHAQMICDKVKVTGTAAVMINYVEEQAYHLPPAIDLAR